MSLANDLLDVSWNIPLVSLYVLVHEQLLIESDIYEYTFSLLVKKIDVYFLRGKN